MTQYLDSHFTINANTRAVQSTWHELVVQAARTEQIFRERGDSREADQVRIYATMFSQFAAMHLKRIVEANGNGGSNGHHTDSTVVTELPSLGLAASEDSTVDGPEPADKTGPCVDCNRGEVVSPDASPAAAVPSNDVEGRIQTMIAQLEDLMVKHRDHQPYEVALKILNRGRTILRSGTDDRGRPLTRERKEDLAERQLRAAFNAAHEAKEMTI